MRNTSARAFYHTDIKKYHAMKQAEYYRLYPDKYKSKSKLFIQRDRAIVIELLGNKCTQCGFSDLRALHIDHINGGGKREFLKLGNGQKYYKHIAEIIKNGNGQYQLLCANCNCIKRIENKECTGRINILQVNQP